MASGVETRARKKPAKNHKDRSPKLRAADVTKFDHWLMQAALMKKRIEMHFAVPPRNNESRMTDDVVIIEVDKFMVLIEFSDGQCFWVSKAIIVSSGLADE